jgi:serine/threonine protein kinase
MGSVYLAQQTGPRGFCREVVLKFIRFDDSVTDERRRRLGDEAQLTALVDHPNVVKLLEIKERGGQLFMALERVAGINFLTLLRRVPDHRLPPPLAAALMAQACDGLHAVHEARQGPRPLNIIHRDVSPMNLMLDTAGRVRVIDLGIARADVRQWVTAEPQVQGNLAYMAPEQWNRQPLDRTVDVYAAALVFYELCTGVHPFDRSILRCEPPPLRDRCPEVTPELGALVDQALALDPARRPPQISILGQALADEARTGGFPGPAQISDYFAALGVSLAPPEPRPVALDELEPDDARDARPPPPTEPQPPPADPRTLLRPPPVDPPRTALRPPPTDPRTLLRPPPPVDPSRTALRPADPRTTPRQPLDDARLLLDPSRAPVARTQPSRVDGPRILLDPPGMHEVRLPDGWTALVYTTWLDDPGRGPQRLLLSAVPDLLPGALTVTLQGNALVLRGEPADGGPARASLYADAQDPSTRLEQILLGRAAEGQDFDFGHRRHVVRRLRCVVGHRSSDACCVRTAAPELAMVAPRACVTLVVVATHDPTRRHVHLEALCVRG